MSLSVYGQYGVQLFFVLSAFTLCHSLEKITVLTKEDYLGFMTKRFFRIAPLYYLGIVFYFLFTYLALNLVHYTPFTAPSNYSAIGVLSNVLFLHGLVPEGNTNIVPGGWSIGCEFLFYAVFPFLFVKARAHRWVLLFSAIIAGLITLTLQIVTSKIQGFDVGLNTFTYFSVSNQFPCFILGMIYYFYQNQEKIRRLFLILFVPSLIAIWLLHTTVWGWCLLPLAAGVASVGTALLIERKPIPALLQKIGQLSFSMYLWHFIVVWTVSPIFKAKLPHSDLFSILQFFIIIALTYVMAEISNRLIENPGIALGHRMANRLRKNRNIGHVNQSVSNP